MKKQVVLYILLIVALLALSACTPVRPTATSGSEAPACPRTKVHRVPHRTHVSSRCRRIRGQDQRTSCSEATPSSNLDSADTVTAASRVRMVEEQRPYACLRARRVGAVRHTDLHRPTTP